MEQDSPWKVIIEELFEDFLAFFFPDIHKDIDFSKGYQFRDKELEKILKSSKTGKRYSDKLVEVFLKDGSEQWLYIHIEIQGKREKNFAERIYIYNYRIFDKFRKEVISLVLFTDKYPKFKPCEYRRERWDFKLIFRYPVKKITDYREQWEELKADPNPFSLVVRAYLKALDSEKNKAEQYHWKRFFVLEAYGRGMKPETVWAIIRFIDWIMVLPDELENEILDAVKTIEEAKKMPHVFSAERLGMKKGMREVVLSLMDDRFGVIPEEIQKKIQAVKDAERLKQIATMVSKVQSLEELSRAMD